MSALASRQVSRRQSRRNLYLLLLLFALVQLQATLMPQAALGQSMPLLPVIAVVSWSILRGPAAGTWWALIMGLLLDWRSPEPLGVYSLAMLLVALVSGLGSRRIFAHNLLLPAVLVMLGTSVFLLSQLIMVELAGGNLSWDRASLVGLLVPGVMLNLLWLPVIYFPLRAVAEGLGDPRIGWER